MGEKLPPSLGGKMKNFYLITEFKPSLYLIPPQMPAWPYNFYPHTKYIFCTKFSLNGTLLEKFGGIWEKENNNKMYAYSKKTGTDIHLDPA